MFYFSTPLYVSFAHIKATNAHSTVSPIIIIIILFIYILYICKLHSSSNKQKDTHRESEHTFFSQHKRPLSTPKHNCKMQFFLLSNTSMFTFSLSPSLSFCSFVNFAHCKRKHIRTCVLLHTQTRTQQCSSLLLSLALRYETLTRRRQATATRAQVQMLG